MRFCHSCHFTSRRFSPDRRVAVRRAEFHATDRPDRHLQPAHHRADLVARAGERLPVRRRLDACEQEAAGARARALCPACERGADRLRRGLQSGADDVLPVVAMAGDGGLLYLRGGLYLGPEKH